FTIVSLVCHLSMPKSPLSFSRYRYFGLRISVKRTISKNKDPLVSSNPPRFPEIEKLWHGNSPQITSTYPLSDRICSSDTVVMSCAVHSPFVLCIASYDFLAYLSNST